jgi:pimeloyl-ACP methyl ester carboxylesterase
LKTLHVALSHGLAAVLALASAGCTLLPRPATVPMRTLVQPAPCPSRPDTLLVVLPGAYSSPEEFVREGFVRAVHERQLALDVWLVDAHLGYYRNRSILERLRADVLAPARARGYRKVWLLGVSVGAFGAIGLAQSPGAAVAGIVALGPYLGEPRATGAVAAAGGLRSWQAPAVESTDDDPDFAVWRWLQGYALDPDQRPPLYLGYGLTDRFAANHALLAAVLPPEQVLTDPGGHDWPAWTPLWRRALARIAFPVDARCDAATIAASP